MRTILALTTFNRLDYLRLTLQGWRDTRNPEYEWHVIVADDGSEDETLDFVQHFLVNETYSFIRNDRRGIHHQTNQIFRLCESLDFDVAFKIDDDIQFKRPGWDTAYVTAIERTGYDHLVLHDPHWHRVKKQRPPMKDRSGLLECRSFWDDCQGAFWTFTPRVLRKVGYFDTDHFHLCGFGHRDYTYRCCRAGFNDRQNIFDLRGSLKYVELLKEGYRSAPDRNVYHYLWNTPEMREAKFSHFDDGRLYVPYNERHVDLYGRSILKVM
jgi:glycosyltransferase involved in cell wall biosynthesis